MRTWLIGAGAMTLVGAVLFAVAFELWSDGTLKFPQARPEFEIVGLPAFAVGAADAVGTGGWRGVLALVLLASVWTVMVPFLWPFVDREFFLRQLWAYGGIAIGVSVAAVRPLRLYSAALVAAGIYAIAIAPTGVLGTVILQGFCQSGRVELCIGVVHALSVLFHLAGGAAAGLLVGRQLSFRAATLLALTLALPSAVVVAHQGWMWQWDGPLSLLQMAEGVVGGLALLVTATFARTTGGIRLTDRASSLARDDR